MYVPGTEQINCNGTFIELPSLEVVRSGNGKSSKFFNIYFIHGFSFD